MVGAEAPDQFELRAGSEADHLPTSRLRKLDGGEVLSPPPAAEISTAQRPSLAFHLASERDMGTDRLPQDRNGKHSDPMREEEKWPIRPRQTRPRQLDIRALNKCAADRIALLL